uniref:Multiple epidermal growth factor-like domains protein 10 n=1 Tax=Crassostrea virginica TaxID=6565 RepID=A0A8B8BS84_CRAVI|nr:multiple epidermal growth factor-like domains protein 10 [Crassostrea virginica]
MWKGVIGLLFNSWVVIFCPFGEAYENLALLKPTWQSATLLTYGADRATDGEKYDLSKGGGQCAVSRSGKLTAEWRVDLESLQKIHHVFIQYVTGNRIWDVNNVNTKTFLGFSVYLSNTTDKEDGVLCFRDTNYTRATIPNPVNIECPYHGRYIIYHNNRTHIPYPTDYSNYAFTNLCEVEVYDCPLPGYYGENCSKECPKNCWEGFCDTGIGTCLGCVPGYIGPQCDQECPERFYGHNCLMKCSETCATPGRCDKVNGYCIGGCQAGWRGDMCHLECFEGSYGQGCLNNCSTTCGVLGTCDKVTGFCFGGCQAGWKGDMCESGCENDTFGENCTEACGFCINGEPCHNIDGTCKNGCDLGFQGLHCTEGNTISSILLIRE